MNYKTRLRLRMWILAGFIFASFSRFASAETLPAPAEKKPANLSASSTVAYTNSMDVLDDKRTLGIGDKVSFRVVEDRKEPVVLTITDSGEMEVPLIGRISANNKTCKQLAYAIKGPLEKTYFYKATVIIGLDTVSVKSRGRIYVTGQVKNQGPLDIPPDEIFTVSKAIIRAGGLADFAQKKKVKLIRKGSGNRSAPETLIINLEDVMEKGRSDLDPVLRPDDTIIVPTRLINI